MTKLYEEEKEELIEAMERNLEVYFENLNDCKRSNKYKRDSVMSKFDQKKMIKISNSTCIKLEW